ncbi:MAG: DUF4160 domain-containing protein [Clostridia bacterium]|nr:DUF4160 domain-containing protein [Clostridia bacterium]MBP5780539.1 DUF4160 domain-containing protein [Clostridia bacterium]
MPILARFYGTVIRMYFRQAEHNPPHVHAIFGNEVAVITIRTGDVLEGYLPPKVLEKVQKWVSINRTELLKIWETQEFRPVPPLT